MYSAVDMQLLVHSNVAFVAMSMVGGQAVVGEDSKQIDPQCKSWLIFLYFLLYFEYLQIYLIVVPILAFKYIVFYI